MNKYLVRGLYTISFEMEVEAESREEAEQMGYEIGIHTEWNGNSVFTDSDAQLEADGEPRNITVEFLEGCEDDEFEEEEEDEEW